MTRLDEHTIRRERGPIGFLGPISSSLTLAWLASHRGRLRTLIVGGQRLSFLVIWDRQGNTSCPERTDVEVEALRTVVFGPRSAA